MCDAYLKLIAVTKLAMTSKVVTSMHNLDLLMKYLMYYLFFNLSRQLISMLSCVYFKYEAKKHFVYENIFIFNLFDNL